MWLFTLLSQCGPFWCELTHNTNADVARHKSKQEVDTEVHVSVDGWILLLMSLY